MVWSSGLESKANSTEGVCKTDAQQESGSRHPDAHENLRGDHGWVIREGMPSAPVAIVDIGSNSIKVLVATRDEAGGVRSLMVRTLDARISAGISRREPRLNEEGMARGLEAVRTLLADAAALGATTIRLVATSAVRDAQNGPEFSARVLAATGHEIRILTGEEEACLIGRGLTTDPGLRERRDFFVFDLGGGSLEALAFRDRHIAQAVSLPLGCVRLTEAFVADPARPIPLAVVSELMAHTRDVLARSGFRFDLPANAVAVGTGGTVATVRAMVGARAGKAFEATEPVVAVAALHDLLRDLAALSLEERKQVPGLPAARADVFPAALATLIAVAELGGFPAFHHSLHNLRFGLADALLPP